MPKLNTTTSGIITATLTADSSPTLELQQNGVAIRTLGESQLVQSTAQSTATGATLYDFTGIPSWAKRITVMLSGVSTNAAGSSLLSLQIGTSGGVENSGYTSYASYIASGSATTTSTSMFLLRAGSSATADVHYGLATLTLLSTNLWVMSFTGGMTSGVAYTMTAGGSKTLSGTLDRVRITTVNGTDTFDAGSVNIMWE